MSTRRQFMKTTIAGIAAAAAGPDLLASPNAANAAERTAPDAQAPPNTIDWHSHWISPRVIEILKRRTDGPRIVTDHDGRLAFLSSARPSDKPFPLAEGFTDAGARLRHLDQVGVQHQVISWATTLGLDAVLPAEDAKPIWSAFNEELSDLVKRNPSRLSGYAVVPTSDIPWAAQELDRAYRQLGLIGVVLPVGAFQTLEGAKHLKPILDVTQKHRGVLYIHSGAASPQIPGQTVLTTAGDDAASIRRDLEWTSTYARGVITLTQTGYLDPYPDVTVQIAMLGGAAPLLASWLRLHAPDAGAPDPFARLRRAYFDASTSRAPLLLDLAARTIGADRILFGSDYPIVSVEKTIAAVHGSSLSHEEKRQIFAANGQKLLAARLSAAAAWIPNENPQARFSPQHHITTTSGETNA